MCPPNEISSIKKRRQALKVWLILNEKSQKDLAEYLGIEPPTLSVHLGNPTMPTEHHARLVNELGVPKECLPAPMDLPPGPRPKESQAGAMP